MLNYRPLEALAGNVSVTIVSKFIFIALTTSPAENNIHIGTLLSVKEMHQPHKQNKQ